MPYTDVDDASIYYEVHGEGPAVVLVHGTGGNHVIWWQQVPYFRERYAVVTVDLPGFGSSRSEREEYDTHEYPAHILAILDHAEIERAVLVGQSLGAAPCLSVAVRHPGRVAGVVLANSVGGIADDEIASLVLADRAEAVKLPVIDRLLTKRFQSTEPEKVFLFAQMGTFNDAKMPQLRNAWVGTTTLEQIHAAISAGVHVYFLGGDEDSVLRPSTYQRVKELLPEADFDVVPGAPHSMYWEAPELFNTALQRMLGSIYPT